MVLRTLLLLLALIPHTLTDMSIEKCILDSATIPDMFEVFHAMPDGMMKVYHELDMLLSLDQYKQLYMEDDSEHGHNRHKRKAAVNLATRWPDGKVYYEITDKRDKEIIKEAIKEWETYSCLTFNESDTAVNRIQFKSGDMCLSAVGMQGGPQPVHLASGCRTKGIIAHEIGHAVGWFHEHMRPDRDDYLNINFKAIPEKYRMHYKKYSTEIINTYDVQYDYTSIMHYGDSAFPGSMVARDPRYQDKIGQRDGLSFKDIKMANVMYTCAEVMKCPKITCPSDGFQLYKQFKNEAHCQCWCDSGNASDPLVLCSTRQITPTTPPVSLPPLTEEPEMKCMDVRNDCKKLKELGKCKTKMTIMMSNCAKTCGFCGKAKDMCMDYETGCGLMSSYCNNPGLKATMSTLCMGSCDLCLKPPDPCDIHNAMFGDHPADTAGTSTTGTSTTQDKNIATVMLSTSVMVISASVISYLMFI